MFSLSHTSWNISVKEASESSPPKGAMTSVQLALMFSKRERPHLMTKRGRPPQHRKAFLEGHEERSEEKEKSISEMRDFVVGTVSCGILKAS